MTEKEQDQLYIDLGIKIKEARENAGFKQGVFSQMLNLSRASVVNIEKGRQRPPLYLIYKIAKITDCSLRDILPVREENQEEEKLKTSWKNKISKSAKGDVETREKLTRFLKEVIINKDKDETVPKKN